MEICIQQNQTLQCQLVPSCLQPYRRVLKVQWMINHCNMNSWYLIILKESFQTLIHESHKQCEHHVHELISMASFTLSPRLLLCLLSLILIPNTTYGAIKVCSNLPSIFLSQFVHYVCSDHEFYSNLYIKSYISLFCSLHQHRLWCNSEIH